MSLAVLGLILALLPAAMFAANWRRFGRLPPATGIPAPVSVLIPARNEAAGIVRAVECVLASEAVDLELIVLDDHSEDATADLVRKIATRDARVRLESARPLPPGWCGKQFACQQLAEHSRRDLMVFIDADVRLAPDALSRMAAHMNRQPTLGLLSGFPHQQTETFLEQLLIPMIHFVLLGFLPLSRMRISTDPSLGAGCGQLFMARRDAYVRAGGHAAIRASLHDGIQLPRAFRRAGVMTDLFDATDVAECRMYRSAGEVWLGLAKNAVEGMAAPRAIVPWTIILIGGQVMPLVLLLIAIAAPIEHRAAVLAMSAAAVTLSLTVRLLAAGRLNQSRLSALLHPIGIASLIAVQWHALIRHALRLPATWKGRAYGGTVQAPQDEIST